MSFLGGEAPFLAQVVLLVGLSVLRDKPCRRDKGTAQRSPARHQGPPRPPKVQGGRNMPLTDRFLPRCLFADRLDGKVIFYQPFILIHKSRFLILPYENFREKSLSTISLIEERLGDSWPCSRISLSCLISVSPAISVQSGTTLLPGTA